jgi:thiamine biosynthesis protein ThiS
MELDAETVAAVLEHFSLTDKKVAVELDGVVVDRKNWADTAVRDGAVLEIVQFVSGG